LTEKAAGFPIYTEWRLERAFVAVRIVSQERLDCDGKTGDPVRRQGRHGQMSTQPGALSRDAAPASVKKRDKTIS
jgi:hypothetical protein